MMIASKKLYFNDNGIEIAILICIHLPQHHGDSWSCAYRIEWPDRTINMDAYGNNAFQAILLAMQMIGAEIYASEYHESGKLRTDGITKGYGFPVTKNLRDLLIGEDIDL